MAAGRVVVAVAGRHAGGGLRGAGRDDRGRCEVHLALAGRRDHRPHVRPAAALPAGPHPGVHGGAGPDRARHLPGPGRGGRSELPADRAARRHPVRGRRRPRHRPARPTRGACRAGAADLAHRRGAGPPHRAGGAQPHRARAARRGRPPHVRDLHPGAGRPAPRPGPAGRAEGESRGHPGERAGGTHRAAPGPGRAAVRGPGDGRAARRARQARCGHRAARPAADPRPDRRAGGEHQGGGPDGERRGQRYSPGAATGRGAVGVPDRAGGAEQCAAARAGRPRLGPPHPPADRSAGGGRQLVAGAARLAVAGGRSRTARHAGAGGDARRHPDGALAAGRRLPGLRLPARGRHGPAAPDDPNIHYYPKDGSA